LRHEVVLAISGCRAAIAVIVLQIEKVTNLMRDRAGERFESKITLTSDQPIVLVTLVAIAGSRRDPDVIRITDVANQENVDAIIRL
jgi:hypothetical protein